MVDGVLSECEPIRQKWKGKGGERLYCRDARSFVVPSLSPPFYRVRDKNTEIARENKGEISLCAGI